MPLAPVSTVDSSLAVRIEVANKDTRGKLTHEPNSQSARRMNFARLSEKESGEDDKKKRQKNKERKKHSSCGAVRRLPSARPSLQLPEVAGLLHGRRPSESCGAVVHRFESRIDTCAVNPEP